MYVVKKVELEMVWKKSYLNPHKFITHVGVGFREVILCVNLCYRPTTLLLSNYEICYHYKMLEVMHNLNVLGLKKKRLVQMLQQFLPHHTKFSCHIWQIIDTSKSLVLL